MKNFLGYLQRIGKALMLPIATMPAMAILLGLGQTMQTVENVAFMVTVGGFLFQVGLAVIGNLVPIFAVGVGIGLAKKHKEIAALASLIGYFVLDNAAKTLSPDFNMSVFTGIVAGIIAASLVPCIDWKVPDYLAFFSGKRLLPIMTALTSIVVGVVLAGAFRPFNAMLSGLNGVMEANQAVGLFAYGLINRMLIPVGLHHILNSFFWFLSGEFTNVAGEVITGDLHRFFAGDTTAGIYMAGYYPIMMFGLPAAAIAIGLTAKPNRRKATLVAMLSLAFTSFLTGITEPIEFSFMFVAPVLFLFHGILTGLSLVVTYLMGALHGFGFSAGLIDYLVNFTKATNPEKLLFIGVIMGALYFVLFYFAIKFFNLKTPGREDESDEDDLTDNSSVVSSDIKELAVEYAKALGGYDNLIEIDNCVTRLRLKVKSNQVDEKRLKALGAKGVVKLGADSVQVIVGGKVERLADAMNSSRK